MVYSKGQRKSIRIFVTKGSSAICATEMECVAAERLTAIHVMCRTLNFFSQQRVVKTDRKSRCCVLYTKHEGVWWGGGSEKTENRGELYNYTTAELWASLLYKNLKTKILRRERKLVKLEIITARKQSKGPFHWFGHHFTRVPFL